MSGNLNQILRIFKNMMRLSLGLALVMLFILVLKFNPKMFSGDALIAEKQVGISAPDQEVFPGEIGSVDPESGLIIDNGFTIVKTQCGACHSTRLVAQNNFSREGWLELIRWMQDKQNLWDLGEQEGIILDYLEKNFAPKQIGRRKNLKIENWYVLNE